MKYLAFVLISIVVSNSLAQPIAKKLGEIPRSSNVQKEIDAFIPKSPTDWVPVGEMINSANQKFVSKAKTFTIKSGNEAPESGDLARFPFELIRDGKKANLARQPISWVTVTPDEKYIIFEPLIVLDAVSWKELDLTKVRDSQGYFQLLKYSSTGKKIIVAEFTCAMDCPKTDKFVIWEYSLK